MFEIKKDNLFSRNQEPLFFISVSVADLVFIYFIKYSTYRLSPSEFNLLNFGNFLNFAITLIIVSLITYLVFKHPEKLKKKRNLLSFFFVISNIFLAVGGILAITGISISDAYFFKTAATRVISGLVFFVYQAFQFVVLTYLWLMIFDKKNFVFLRIVSNLFLISFVLLTFTLIYTQIQTETDEGLVYINKPMDVTVVFGAAVWPGNKPSTLLKLRLQKAVDLYWDGCTKKIQLTGSNAPGEFSEAEVSRIYISQFSVEPKDILMEQNSTSTVEQVNYIQSDLKEQKKFKKIAVVSDKFHLSRIREICRFFNVDVYLVASDSELPSSQKAFYMLREAVSLINFWFFAVK